MANKKISALTAAGTLTGTEPVPIVQGGQTVRTTTADIAGTSPLGTGTAGYALIGNGASVATYQGFLQSGTGATTRTWNAKVAEIVSVKDFGAVGDGVTDDTTAINAWLAALTTGVAGYIPAGTYLFTSALTKATGANFAIIGAGAYQSIFMYAGVSTTIDLFTIGNGTGGRATIVLENFRVDSNTTMTNGHGFRLRGLARSFLTNLVAGGQDGNNKLYDGIYFDQADFVIFNGFNIRTLNDGLKVKGGSSGPIADLFLTNGKIGSCGRYGIVVGGGFGGLYVDSTDVIGNASHGVIIDQSLSANVNREVFFGPGCLIDTNGGAGVYFDNGFGASGYCGFTGTWIASNGSHGIDVSATETGASRIQINGGTIYNNIDGIRITATQPAVCVNGTLVRNNSGWGINNAGAGTNARIGLNYFISNTLGQVTGANYITAENGNFSIGSTAGGDRALTIGSDATGAVTCYGIRNNQVVQSDVTTAFNGSATNIGTQATAFTLTNLRHHYSRQGTFGAGSAVTNQYGFYADSNLTGATNNYGFRGDIAAAANCWNIYINGTADNYFAGNVLCGNPTAIAMADAQGNALTPVAQVQGVAAAAASLTTARWTNSVAPPRIVLGKSRGTSVGSQVIVQSGDGLGEIVWVGDDGTNFAPAAQIRAEVDGTPGNNDMPGRLKFATTADGGNSVTDRLILDSLGALKPATDGGAALGTTTLRYASLALVPTAFASLPTPAEGMVAEVTDSNTATWGATIAGGGANNVMAFYNGANWTVMAA